MANPNHGKLVNLNGHPNGDEPITPKQKAQAQLNLFARNFDSAPTPSEVELQICIAEARKLLKPADGETEIPELDYIAYAHIIFREKFANYKTNLMQAKYDQYLVAFSPTPKIQA